MRLLRTDGGGESFTDEQLQIVKDAWAFFGEDYIEFKVINFENISL